MTISTAEGAHTPGPFVARKGIEEGDEHRCGVFAVRDEGEYLVATIENGAPGDSCDTEFANALLFAAAPDFADVAPDAADLLEQYAGYIRTVKAAELERHPYLPELERVAEALRAAIALATQNRSAEG